jgi:hypothetical protein
MRLHVAADLQQQSLAAERVPETSNNARSEDRDGGVLDARDHVG